jgi:hydroxymethylglutaryl-CoA lyase
MNIPGFVKIVEVGPRDGLQNEPHILPAVEKIEFIDRLSQTGLSVIETTSFVSPRWIPQLADHAEVFQGIKQRKGVQYPVLVPNLTGLRNALASKVKEVAVFTSPSEQFNQHNIHCSVEESLHRIAEVLNRAKEQGVAVRGYLSCVLGCPYEGKIAPQRVAELAQQLIKLGCYEVSLGDTIGVGTPLQAADLLRHVADKVPLEKLAVHFHDTYGQALANIYAALELGVAVVDSAVAGLGGCPYAKGASGNVATEDLLYMLNGMGIETGIDLQKLVAVGRWIAERLGKKSLSRLGQACAKED